MRRNTKKAVTDTAKAIAILATAFAAITFIFTGAENGSEPRLAFGFLLGFIAYIAGKRFAEAEQDAKEQSWARKTMKELLDEQKEP